MMRMQPEAEGYSDQVSCGGAARRLDVSALSELRNRVAGAHDALDDASSAVARTANAPSFATAAAMSAEAVAEDDGLDARRRILRRRVLLALAASVAILATACWEYLPGILAWLADPQAVRSFVADHSVISRLVMLGINVTQIFLAFLPGEPVEAGERLRVWLLGGDGAVPRRLGAGDVGDLLGDASMGLELGWPLLRPQPSRPVFVAQ